MQNRNNVRITDEAHALLSEKAEDYNVSMKDFASEAVLLLAKGKEIKKECCMLLDRANDRIIVLDARILNNSRYAIGAFALGAVVAGCLMFFVGAVLW